MDKLVSFNLYGDFGMLKKPDTNEPVYLTYNMLHKPALLGILGAILGLRGFQKQKELPEYYSLLNELKVGIKPLQHENGNFSKTIIKYNNSTGMASEEQGGNLMIAEQTLVKPAYQCFICLSSDNRLHIRLLDMILSYSAEYIPYLGKNDCSVWWENAEEHSFQVFEPIEDFKIDSIFIKDKPVKEGKTEEVYFSLLRVNLEESPFMYFENLPIGYIGAPLFQYEFRSFAFTNATLKSEYPLPENFSVLKLDSGSIIQVF
ncbi:CRISPR-associated protein, Cas5h family [Fulvivirga imtechensis AK7]|uniref:CRISPR-associated protein, Cas5h family n=1 Tax=Fulvivirga imtechensis AK7 TaxID=1237149 RepID=L8K0G0_9BACT|nr:type I-B CRISPR-associated protein Cas5b [Fulvivirga imtechensis]ELR72967.1 CRISPR-associated protein, Cas5h family [Fulvivirga imtechensis AK7]